MQGEPSMDDIRDFRKKDDGQTRHAFKLMLIVGIMFGIAYTIASNIFETDEIPHQRFETMRDVQE